MLTAMESFEFFPKVDRESLLLWCSRPATLAPHPFQPIPVGRQPQQKLSFMVFDSKPGQDRTQKGECVLSVDVDIPDIPARRTLGCFRLPTMAFEAGDPGDEFYNATTCVYDGHASGVGHPSTGHPLRVNADTAFTINETGDVCQLDIGCFAEFVMGLYDTSVPLVPLAGSGVMARATVDSPPAGATLEWREIPERFGFFAVGASSLFGHGSKIVNLRRERQ